MNQTISTYQLAFLQLYSMLLIQSSFFSASPKNISFQKCERTSKVNFSNFEKCGKRKLLLFDHSGENNCSNITRNHWKTEVVINGYSYFPSLHHPLESELLAHEDEDEDEDGGIGIVKFFQGKNIFITGATGLVGKAFIEKLLRSTPVGKIYVLIKAQDKRAALDRLDKEIITSELFKCLSEKYGNSYEEFVKEKLVPVVGNICEPNLGMDSESARAIMEQVDVVIGSAASTSLNDRYDFLLNMNVNATQRLMRFAKTCKNLKLFVHMSTAYVNGRKEGLILEKPLVMGGNGMNEGCDNQIISSPLIPRLDVADEMSLVLRTCRRASNEYDVTKDLKSLGQTRANMFGWYNAYHMTKAMGEMVLDEMRGDTPVLIIRPTVIESTYKEPIPGWIQGNRMFDPVIISYGKGQLPAFLADPQVHMDIIPVDMVVNSTIAAIAIHGAVHHPQVNVYQVASGVVNPLRFSEFFETIYEYFNSAPLNNSRDVIGKIKCFDDFNDFSKYTREKISQVQNGCPMSGNAAGVNGKMIHTLQKQQKAKVVYAEQLCKMYEFIGFFKGRFHTGNSRNLLREMSKREQLEFEIDVGKNRLETIFFGYSHSWTEKTCN